MTIFAKYHATPTVSVVGRFEHLFFQVPDHLARRPSVTLTARDTIGDFWQVTVAGQHDVYHWSIQPTN